jgi:3-deoxy-D-manno-octulosonate 8-phosphate phosphatase (KDO 8-P phosphatase)
MSGQIRCLVLDIDGVITDGTILLMPSGDEVRSVHFHDIDAIARIQREGVTVAILSGEDTPSSHRVAARLGITAAAWGAKDKAPELAALTDRLGFSLAQTCYVGDADRDVPAIEAAGLGLAPADATVAARKAANRVLASVGGHGAVAEAIDLLGVVP